MKTLLTTAFAILLFTVTCGAQNTFPATGNVGIGTTTPAGKLQVQNSTWDLLTSTSTLDIGVSGNTGGWARALRVVNSSGSNGTDGGAFGVYGLSTTPNYVYMAIPTATTSPIGYNSTNILALDNSGNVGIGTISPGLKAHILGPVGFPVTSGSAQTGILRLQGTSSSAVLDFGVNGGAGAALQVTSSGNLALTYPLLLNPNGGSVGIGTSPSFASGTGLEIQQAGPVTLRMQNSTNSKSMELRQTATYFSLFNINAQHTILAENGGNVGIGTTSPASSLQVVGDFRFGTNGTYTDLGVFSDSPLSGYNQTNSITPVSVPGSGTSKAALYLKNKTATGTTRMDLLVDGNVGIGTTSPTTTLDVASSSTTAGYSGITLENSGATGNEAGLILKGGYTTGSVTSGRIYSKFDGGTSYTNARVTIQSMLSGGIFDDTFSATNGKVGIGTMHPDQKLTVNGTIHSSEVIVDTNIPTPDYVFDKTYDLPTLTSVKTYIDKNHHLSEIPSAAEVAKNGQRVGEMNMLLLKKVEELTLYLIERDKQDEKKAAQLTEQQVQIDQLKQQLIELKKSLNKN